MSGHSKWANIKRRKGKVDEERGKIFTKISKEIHVAVRQGGADPEGNFRLKLCIQNAKANNMPAENINRAIAKAAGAGSGDDYEEIFYEGYGAGGAAVLCAIMTNNRNRTASEIRYLFSRNNGNMGETGCVSWMFERKGQLIVSLEDKDPDDLMLLALEAGAEDFAEQGEEAEIITAAEALETVREAVLAGGYEVKNGEITMLAGNTITVESAEQAQKLLKLTEALEDNDDVRAVYANYNIPDEILEQME
ncbi:MAG: YebC/PmpR family DNA-binding transcriptional regulator [Clostridiales bacterium]|nr:YebC/PmpR family DNA-binding transcriptional regulator [Clostridiales bacterium]